MSGSGRVARGGRGRRAPWPLALLLAAAGCGTDVPQASLRLLTPTPDQVLTLADDADDMRSGLQFHVTGAAREIDRGTTVALFVDDERRPQSTKVGAEGSIDFGDVTLPPGEHLIHLETGTGGSSSDRGQQYTFRALLIRSPADGSRLSAREDENGRAEDGLQISATVEAFALPGAEVRLLLDDQQVGKPAAPDSHGIAAFANITLEAGPHRLLAQAGAGDELIASPVIGVEVDEGSCAKVAFTAPSPPLASDAVTIGGPELCMREGAFLYTVRLSTDAGRGRSARLFVNDLPAGDAIVGDKSIEFPDVELPRKGGLPNSLRVELQGEDGTSCSLRFPADVYVDCEGPSCAITAPVPVQYVDADQNSTAYLNAAMMRHGGFDVSVQTDLEPTGTRVQLLIDGAPGDMLSAPASAGEGGALARFERVALGEGEHTVEALCSDLAGNVSSSEEQTWVVDTSPCSIAIGDPVDGTRFVPADDDDSSSVGTQVLLTTAVGGSDCVAQRARVCDPQKGIESGEFMQFSGASLIVAPRLDDAAAAQQLCVEVQDRAGNIAFDSVQVSYLHEPPAVAIESPLDGDELNILGNAGFVADADPATAGVCEAEFSVACSELGADVELHQDDAQGALLASGPCSAPAPGDPELPPGFAGRARIVAPFDDGDGSGTVVATQALSGKSTKQLIGSSAAVTLDGDCVAPAPALVGDPCDGAGDGLLVIDPPATTSVSANITAHTSDADLTNLALAISNSDATSSVTDSPDQPAPGDHTWPSVLLGGIGTVTITATARDAFANIGQAQCTAQITADPPALSMIAPNNGAAFGPRAAYTDTCNTGATGEYGIAWSAELDQASDRKVSLYVDGALVMADVPHAGTAVSACVPVPDDAAHAPAGPALVTARVATTQQGNAYVDYARAISVHTVEIVDPTEGQALQLADDCLSGPAFGYLVRADVDVMHRNASFALSSGVAVEGVVSGLEVSGCVRLPSGQRTITANIAGSPARDAISVQVP